jgi:hypothetical protein
MSETLKSLLVTKIVFTSVICPCNVNSLIDKLSACSFMCYILNLRGGKGNMYFHCCETLQCPNNFQFHNSVSRRWIITTERIIHRKVSVTNSRKEM